MLINRITNFCYYYFIANKCVIPVVCVKFGKLFAVIQNCVTGGVFNDYIMDNYMFQAVLAIFNFS